MSSDPGSPEPAVTTSDPGQPGPGPASAGPAVPGWDIIRATTADAPALAAVIAEAFLDLPPSRWLIPEPDTRRRAYPGYFLLYVEHALDAGIVHTTPRRDAAALWLPSDCPPPPDYPARLAAATAPWTSRFQKFDEVLDRHHPASPPHRHLAILAVRPAAQGRGAGTALLAAYHRRLDQLGMPAYLEASAPRSRLLYQRHGYTGHGPPIHLPDGTPMWPMWREPCEQPEHLSLAGR
jgi:GNAT superfamily N-acetyltransferase